MNLLGQQETVVLPRIIAPPAGSCPRFPTGVRVRVKSRPKQTGRVRAAHYVEPGRWDYVVAWDLSCDDWFHLRMIGWTNETLDLDGRPQVARVVPMPTSETLHATLAANGGSLSATAKAFGVPLTTILRWQVNLGAPQS